MLMRLPTFSMSRMRSAILIADGAGCGDQIPQLDRCVTVYRGL